MAALLLLPTAVAAAGDCVGDSAISSLAIPLVSFSAVGVEDAKIFITGSMKHL